MYPSIAGIIYISYLKNTTEKVINIRATCIFIMFAKINYHPIDSLFTITLQMNYFPACRDFGDFLL
jgi:hypothetical protein